MSTRSTRRRRTTIASPVRIVELNFGLVEIDWEAPSPRITLQIIDVEGNVQLEHELHLNELRDQ